ncbi:hypothetical protein JTE90_006711 [Oedothorax gibbosus]|uniref:Uncharacterized protein n=1 Tax=Oedothorax gibbosus TaxID=931172 RepID=A0AAV6UJZ2_9ARAC|nr:hypothetical protein JTE90_006711 [Oedothorax gibbosus]
MAWASRNEEAFSPSNWFNLVTATVQPWYYYCPIGFRRTFRVTGHPRENRDNRVRYLGGDWRAVCGD